MSRHLPAWALALSLALPFAASTTLLRAQNPTATEALASAWIAALTPAADDPDATARELLRAALAEPRSPVASLLVQEVMNLTSTLQRPADLRAWLLPQLAGPRRHGRLQDRCVELAWRLHAATDGQFAAGLQPPAGYAQHHLLAGPFGDDGDHFVGVVFAPELGFPPAGATLPGRGTVARVHRIANNAYSDYLEFRHGDRPLQGCHYGLTRWRTAADVDAVLELGHQGDCQVFVDGVEVLRVERWRRNAPRLVHVPMHLPAGEHDVVVKCAANDTSAAVLRWLDADAHVATNLQQVEADPTTPPSGARATRRDDPFVTAHLALAQAAAAADAPMAVRLAALWSAQRDGLEDQALDLAEAVHGNPPSDGAQLLAYAQILRTTPLPDELRKARARAAIERGAEALGDGHHTARLLRAQLLEEQDQREQALQLLAAHPAAGPATFSRRYSLLRGLRFEAELDPLLAQWTAACPRDDRPLQLRAARLQGRGDARAAYELLQQALRLRITQDTVQSLWDLSLALGDFEGAARWLELLHPQSTPALLPRLVAQLILARHRGDDAALAATTAALRQHERAGAGIWQFLAEHEQRRGNLDGARECLQRSLQLEPDQPELQAWLQELGAQRRDAEFAPFRKDGKALAAAYVAGEAEQGASLTLVFDQRITVLAEDGSSFTEVHTVRRINDQQGVEAFSQGTGLGSVDELLLLRTIGKDGRDYVPSRIEDDYSLQRLEPGAFVEWRFRVHGDAPGADALGSQPFFLGDGSEPCARAEFVLVRPGSGRGELRTRNLGEPSERRQLDDGREVLVFAREKVGKRAEEKLAPGPITCEPVLQLGEMDGPMAAWRAQRQALLQRTRPTAPLRQLADELFAGLADHRARAEAAWRWCQREVEDGPGDRAVDVLLRKKGNRFVLLVALLRAGSVPVVPMVADDERAELAGDEDSLFPAPPATAAPGACVLLADGGRLHLFADMPRQWRLGAIPAARSGAAAVLLHDERTEPIVLPLADDAVQTLRVTGTATLGRKQLRLEARAVLGDVQGAELAQRVREIKETMQKTAARQVAQQLFQGWRVESAAFATDGEAGKLTIAAVLTRAGVQQNGDEFVVPLPLPNSKFTASLGDRAQRTQPFRLPVDSYNEWNLTLVVADDLVVTALPAPLVQRFGALTFQQELHASGGSLRLYRSVRLAPTTLPAAQFGDWMRALAAADRAEQASITLRARPAAGGERDGK